MRFHGEIISYIKPMAVFRKIIIYLIILSQFCLSFQNQNQFVFCVKDSGNFAIEPSINGTCGDSKQWHNSHTYTNLFQYSNPSASGQCKDYRIANNLFKSSDSENKLGLGRPQISSQPILRKKTNFIDPTSDELFTQPHILVSSANYIRRTIVLLF